MRSKKFDEKLRELSVLAGSDKTDVLFEKSYEDLLSEVRGDRNNARRYGHALRLKRLLMIQAEHLMNRWVKADRENALQ